jgi:hypothetical protein
LFHKSNGWNIAKTDALSCGRPRDRRELTMADDYTNEEPMPVEATRNLLLWASGFGAGAVIVLLGGVLLVNMGVWGHDAGASNTPAAQSAANAPTQPGPNPQQTNPSGTPAPQTTGQAQPPQSAPQQK